MKGTVSPFSNSLVKNQGHHVVEECKSPNFRQQLPLKGIKAAKCSAKNIGATITQKCYSDVTTLLLICNDTVQILLKKLVAILAS